MVNIIWPIAVAGKADGVSSVSTSACHIGGPNSVNPGLILLEYGSQAHKTPDFLIILMCFDIRYFSGRKDYKQKFLRGTTVWF